MRKLVVDWARGPESENSAENGKNTTMPSDLFEFVFLIQLKDIDGNDPLEKIIIQQHGLEEANVTTKEIRYILDRAEKKPLLIFDGYDEYRQETNSAIDEKITRKKGNPFVLVTSRPDHVNKKFKHKMEEIQLRGLDDAEVKKCTERYLDRDQGSKMSKKFQNRAAEHGISNLLKVPILLLMLCVLFVEKETSLPSSKAEIIKELINIYIMRAEERGEEFGEDKEQMLKKLGELSYNASQRKTKQMYIDKVYTFQYSCNQQIYHLFRDLSNHASFKLYLQSEIEKQSSDILKLGLLHEDMSPQRVHIQEQTQWWTYPNRIFQDYLVAYYIQKLGKVSVSSESDI